VRDFSRKNRCSQARSQQLRTIDRSADPLAFGPFRPSVSFDAGVGRQRPAIEGEDWNDMLMRERAGEPLETDLRPLE